MDKFLMGEHSVMRHRAVGAAIVALLGFVPTAPAFGDEDSIRIARSFNEFRLIATECHFDIPQRFWKLDAQFMSIGPADYLAGREQAEAEEASPKQLLGAMYCPNRKMIYDAFFQGMKNLPGAD